MQERHKNRLLYFNEQAQTTEQYVIPYIEQVFPMREGMRILEIGCGEGGNLKPFLDRGYECTGIDLNTTQIANARVFMAGHPHLDKLTLIAEDIYNIEPQPYDLIILRDVIEHIHNQERFMGFLKRFLAPDGVVFFGFPAWQMPFGGHQQICVSKVSKIPYIHLLPAKLYAWILRKAGEQEGTVNALLEIKETGISIERFERIVRKEQYRTLRKTLWFIQPNYEVKFHLHKRRVAPVLRSIPWLRNFYTTAGYYVIAI